MLSYIVISTSRCSTQCKLVTSSYKALLVFLATAIVLKLTIATRGCGEVMKTNCPYGPLKRMVLLERIQRYGKS